jgi:integrase
VSTTDPMRRGAANAARRGRPPTGAVIEKQTRRGTVYAVKFTAYGQRRYVTLGTSADGWNRDRALRELAYVLAQVERRAWQPPAPAGPAEDDPSLHVFASAWFEGIRGQLRPNTIIAYEWELTRHLLPFFRDHRLAEITVAEVDRYREAKVAEGRLGAESINKTLTRLGQVLELAVERELIPRNPVRVNPRRRKLRVPRPSRTFIEHPAHVELLLASVTPERGANPERRAVRSRALLGVLVLAGLRVGEATALQWRDVNLAAGQLHVRAAKTQAGERAVDIVPPLRELLADHKVTAPDPAPTTLVFTTAAGGPLDRGYVNGRVLAGAVRRVNAGLDEDATRLPTLSPHSLRRTCISLPLFAGHPVPYVMSQVGHTDPKVTLGLYAQVLACREPGTVETVTRLVGHGRIVQAPDAWARTT